MRARCADRISYTAKRVLRLDCSGQSHALVTGDSAGQRFRLLTPPFSRRAAFQHNKAVNIGTLIKIDSKMYCYALRRLRRFFCWTVLKAERS
jgi:hypothetical protein